MQIHDSSLSWFATVSSVKSYGNYTGLMCPNLQLQKIKLKYSVWRVIFAGVKFGDFESNRYTKNVGVFKFGGY